MNVAGPESRYINTRVSRRIFLRLTAAAIGSVAGIQPPEATTTEPAKSTRWGVAMPTVRLVKIDSPPVSGPEKIADVPKPEIVYEPVPPSESISPPAVNRAPMTAADKEERKEYQKREDGYFLNDLVDPILTNSTLNRRAQFALQDRNYPKRIDSEINQDWINFGFLGIGGEGELTDLILVCSYNPRQNIASLISFPRDMQSKRVLALTGNPASSRINQGVREAVARGMDPFSIIRKDLEDLSGLSMDYMTMMQPQVMVDFINLVGGIKITLDRDLNNNNFHTTDQAGNKIPEPFSLPAGTYRISGEEAEKIARDRQGSDDYDRHTRQWKIISGFMDAIEESIKSNPLGTPLLFSRLFFLYERKKEEGALVTDYDKEIFANLNNLWSVPGITSKLPYYGLRGRIARYPKIRSTGLNERNLLVKAEIPGVYITRLRNGEESSRKFVRDFLTQ